MNDTTQRRLTVWGPLFLLTGILLVLFFRSFLPEWTLANGDGGLHVFKWHYSMLPEAYTIPMWVNAYSLGNPALVMNVGPGFLMAHVVPFAKYPDANYILHLWLMGITGYFLLRDITGNRFASLLGAIFIMLQPHVVSHILPGHTGHLLMAGFIPGAFLFLRRAVMRDSLAYWGLAGLFFGLAEIAGTHDVTLFFAMLLGAYGIYLLVSRFRASGPAVPATQGPAQNRAEQAVAKPGRSADDAPRPQAPLRFAIRTAAGMVLAIVVLMLVAYQALFMNLFIQVKSTSEGLAKQSAGQEESAEQKWLWATQWSTPVEEAIDFAIPGFFGWGSSDQRNPYRGRVGQTEGYPQHRQGLPNLNDVCNYLGAVIMLGGLTALALRRKSSEMWFFLVAGLIACVLSFGKHAPLYRLFYAIPHMDTMRNPIKWFYVTSFCAGIVAAMGLDAADRRRSARFGKDLALLLVPGIVAVVAAALYLASRGPGDLFWGNPAFVKLSSHAILVGACFWTAAAVLLALLSRLPASAKGPSRAPKGKGPTPPRAGQTAAAWAPVARLGLKIALGGLLVGELFYVNSHYMPYQLISRVIQGGPLADFFNAQPKPFRIKFMGRHPVMNYFNNVLVGYYGWEAVDPPSSRTLDDLALFVNALRNDPKRMLQLTGVKYLVTDAGFRDDFLKPVLKLSAGDTPIGVYEVTPYLPRYHVVPRWTVLAPDADPLEAIAATAFDPWREALVSAGTDIAPPPDPLASNMSCRIESYQWHTIRLKVETDAPAMIVGLDRYDAGWDCTVDGKSNALLRVNYMLRGIPVPAGQHEVVLTRRPAGYRHIPIVALGCLIGLACGVVAITTRRWNSSKA